VETFEVWLILFQTAYASQLGRRQMRVVYNKQACTGKQMGLIFTLEEIGVSEL
jgi:hypothetical protein